jgi:hypothetical protein
VCVVRVYLWTAVSPYRPVLTVVLLTPEGGVEGQKVC